ncbi:hypothetical protein SIO82_003618 [Pluralibacter gergoviae]|nr:hypothetical protein [Pluralibacter gergoviae]
MVYLVHCVGYFHKRRQLESTRRTLENMAAGGLLERVTVYEHRQSTTQGSGDAPGVWCKVTCYGLPGTCQIMRDTGGADNSLSGKCVRVG